MYTLVLQGWIQQQIELIVAKYYKLLQLFANIEETRNDIESLQES